MSLSFVICTARHGRSVILRKGNKMTGTKKINRVIDRFTKLVAELEAGAEEVQSEITTNQDLIYTLKGRNVDLGETKVVALNLIRGITKLINGE